MGLMPAGARNPLTRFDKQRVSRLQSPSSRATVTALAFVPLVLVALSAGPGAQSPTPPRSVAGRAGAPGPQIDANGFKVGEEVLINTGQGWMKGTILSANGNVYRVRSQIGIDVTKILHRSPTELVSDFWTTIASVGLKHNSLSLTAAFIKRENENAIKQQEDAGAKRVAPKL